MRKSKNFRPITLQFKLWRLRKKARGHRKAYLKLSNKYSCGILLLNGVTGGRSCYHIRELERIVKLIKTLEEVSND